MRLKNKIFGNNLIQGPLAGISCAPFRALTWRYSQPAFSCTEMISCKTLLTQREALQRRYLEKDATEGPVCFQLCSQDPHELGAAVARVTDLGADLIDLNCGCPMNKIRKKGTGSALLAKQQNLFQLITAMKKNTTVPVSIKIRVDATSGDQYNQAIVEVVKDAGVDFIIVHGRHWSQDYETPCNYEEIRFFVESLQIPVIGNGDVACQQSLNAMLATGCAGVMISRAGVGQPWLIAKLLAQIKDKPFDPPSLQEVFAIFLEHVERLMLLLDSEKLAILQARKFAKYYVREFFDPQNFSSAINQCVTLDELKKICAQYRWV